MTDDEATEAAPPESPHFSHIKMTAGPHGKNTQILVDGKPLKGVYQAEISANVHDAVRLTTSQFVTVEIDASGEVIDGGFSAIVTLKKARDIDGEWYKDDRIIARGTAASIPMVLRTLADAIQDEMDSKSFASASGGLTE